VFRLAIMFIFAAAASLSLPANVAYAKNWNTGSSNQQQNKSRAIQEESLLSEESELPLCKGPIKKWSKCYGKARLINGAVYFGQFVRGLPNGYGRWDHRDGSWYQGEFLDAREHGKGFYSGYGVTYNGAWVKGKKSGLGRLYNIENKLWYEGEFLKDKKHGFGRGTWFGAKGIIIEGTYNEGGLAGDIVTIIFPDGKKWKGNPSTVFQTGKSSYGMLIESNGDSKKAKLTRIEVFKCPFCIEFDIEKIYQPEPRQRAYTSTGLPMDVGPFYIGMREKEFLQLLSKKSKITRYNSERSGTVTRISNSDKKDVPEVRSLLKSSYGDVIAHFLNDELVKITLHGPAIDGFALKSKYKNPKITTRNWDEVCLLNRLRSTITLNSGTYSWNDDEVALKYSYLENFSRPSANAPAPLCVRGNIRTTSYYSIWNPKKFKKAMSIQIDSRSKSQNKEKDSRLKQF
jgi:hypothetical protein